MIFIANGLQENNLPFTPDIEVATADQILPLVKNNLGIGFIPEELLKDEEDDIFRLKLQEEIPLRSVCYIKRKDQSLSLAAKELERMIIEYTK